MAGLRTCHFCEAALSRSEDYQLITAWVAVGKRDSVTLREDVQPASFACRGCIRKRQLGISEGQATFGGIP
jgi:hypothetical protein